MDTGEYGLTRGTSIVARRLAVVAVTGLLWIRGVFWVRRDFVFRFLFVFFLRTQRTRPAASMRPSCLIYLSTSTGVRTGCHYLISMSVSVCLCVRRCVCNIRRFSRLREPY